MRRLFSVVVVMLPLAGCVSALHMTPLAANHPASPDAEEAPLPVMSRTLVLPERPSESSVAPSSPKSSEEESAPSGGHAGHGGGHGH